MLRLFIFLMLLYIYLFFHFYPFFLHLHLQNTHLHTYKYIYIYVYRCTQAYSFAHSPVDSFESLAFTTIRSQVRSSSMRLLFLVRSNYENALRWLFSFSSFTHYHQQHYPNTLFFPYFTSFCLYLFFYLVSYIRDSYLRPRCVLAELSSFQFVKHTVHLFLLLSFL